MECGHQNSCCHTPSTELLCSGEKGSSHWEQRPPNTASENFDCIPAMLTVTQMMGLSRNITCCHQQAFWSPRGDTW